MAAKKIKIDNASLKFKRQSQRREQKFICCSILIVCEGTKTEPNYFEALAEKQQGVIVYDIEVKGLGSWDKGCCRESNRTEKKEQLRPGMGSI